MCFLCLQVHVLSQISQVVHVCVQCVCVVCLASKTTGNTVTTRISQIGTYASKPFPLLLAPLYACECSVYISNQHAFRYSKTI